MTNYDYKKCPICGIHYAVDADVMAYKACAPKSDRNRGWCCPNGHSLVYTISETDVQRRRAEKAEQEVEYQRQRANTAERSITAHKGQITKLKRRVKVGVCLCCNRTFQNLARHMASKHPDMDPEEPLKIIEGGKR